MVTSMDRGDASYRRASGRTILEFIRHLNKNPGALSEALPGALDQDASAVPCSVYWGAAPETRRPSLLRPCPRDGPPRDLAEDLLAGPHDELLVGESRPDLSARVSRTLRISSRVSVSRTGWDADVQDKGERVHRDSIERMSEPRAGAGPRLGRIKRGLRYLFQCGT